MRTFVQKSANPVKSESTLSFPGKQNRVRNVTSVHEPAEESYSEPGRGFDFGSIPLFSDNENPLQLKLKIGRPGDSYEQEADFMADRIMSMPEPYAVRRQPEEEPEEKEEEETVNSMELRREPEEEEGDKEIAPMSNEISREVDEDEDEETVNPKSQMGKTPEIAHTVQNNINSMRGGGQPLPLSTRAFFEPRFNRDFSGVRLHTDSRAAETAKSINARAFTVGRNIAFGTGQYSPETSSGKRLLAHELTHTVQQERGEKQVQSYETAEHVQLGETQAELKRSFAPTSYTVRKGDRLSIIANKFGITVGELKNANKAKLKKWTAKDGSGRMIEGFNAGEIVSIPQKLNEFAKTAIKDKSAKFTVNGVVLDYGVGIAMGDFFESPEQMSKASRKELTAVAVLIKREQSGGRAVTTEEWQKATGGRYLKLAEKNITHFAPSGGTFVTSTKTRAASPNHKSEWEKYHTAALDASRSGLKDKALMMNAFADHFLTDAFSAGHLVNKREVMEEFKSQLKLKAKSKEFTDDSKKFFNDIAKDAFTGSVKSEFSKYETFEHYFLGWNPNIDSVKTFSTLLQEIHKKEPDMLANVVAKGVHDKLNTISDGLPVENTVGDSWKLSGDGTLNIKTREIARKAVAQSQINVISMYNLIGPLNYTAMYKKVWDYTPMPNKAGTEQLVRLVTKSINVKSDDLKKTIVKMIKNNYKLIIDQLVKRKKLKKA